MNRTPMSDNAYKLLINDLSKAETERDALREELARFREREVILEGRMDKMRDALETLMDWQNGPPLLGEKWETGWGNAMEQARAILEQTKPQP